MPPAARISDLHVCPMCNGLVPHVGGPVAMGCGNGVHRRHAGRPGQRRDHLCRPAGRRGDGVANGV